MTVCGWLFLQKTLLHEKRDGLGNFGAPTPYAGVQNPPVKDAVDRVLGIGMPGKIL
jgi:hypothetical protein